MNDTNIVKKVFIYQECNFGSSKDVIPETLFQEYIDIG